MSKRIALQRRGVVKGRLPGALKAERVGPPWTFYCRKDERGNDVIDDWYSTLQTKAKARFARTLDQLRPRPAQDWQRPDASPIRDHIYVIRFKDHSGIPQRVFGNFVFERAAFVMTVVAIEKDREYIPGNCPDQAARHQQRITANFLRYAILCFNHGP